MSTVEYFAFSRTSLAAMANVEVTVGCVPPTYLDGGRLPLVGAVQRKLGSGKVRFDGPGKVDVTFDKLTRAEYRALLIALLGDLTTGSAQLYLSSISDVGKYVPLYGWVDRPSKLTDFTPNILKGTVFPFHDLIVQATPISANHTVGLGERLVYADTTAGNVTLTLPAAATVTPWTIYSFQKRAAAHSLIIDGAGSELVGGALTQTLTALYDQLDIFTDGSAWFVTVDGS